MSETCQALQKAFLFLDSCSGGYMDAVVYFGIPRRLDCDIGMAYAFALIDTQHDFIE